MAAPNVDLLLEGRVLTQDDRRTELASGAVAVAGDRIVAVGEAAELRERFPAARVLGGKGCLVMPGLVNCHTHAAMSCFRGLADDLPLMEWLENHIFPVEAKLSQEMVYLSTLLSCAEMIRSGTTSFCDMYLFAKEVARAAAASGMRAWVGEVLYDFPSPCYGPLENGYRYVEEMFSDYQGHPLVTVTVDPHAVYTCSPDLLSRLRRVADQHGALYVIHLSETASEVQGCLERYGKTPVMHLDSLGVLGENTVADHCVVLTGEEIELLARRGVRVAHCPESNMKLASGVAPVPKLLEAGVTVGLGTDGAASNNDVDLFGEMDTAAKLHKVHGLDPTLMPASAVLDMATRGGARLLGAQERVGALAPGMQADVIVLDLDSPHLTPLHNPVSQLVYAARGADVLHSVIGGRVVMENRRLLTIDEPALLAEMREMGRRVRRIRQGAA